MKLISLHRVLAVGFFMTFGTFRAAAAETYPCAAPRPRTVDAARLSAEDRAAVQESGFGISEDGRRVLTSTDEPLDAEQTADVITIICEARAERASATSGPSVDIEVLSRDFRIAAANQTPQINDEMSNDAKTICENSGDYDRTAFDEALMEYFEARIMMISLQNNGRYASTPRDRLPFTANEKVVKKACDDGSEEGFLARADREAVKELHENAAWVERYGGEAMTSPTPVTPRRAGAAQSPLQACLGQAGHNRLAQAACYRDYSE